MRALIIRQHVVAPIDENATQLPRENVRRAVFLILDAREATLRKSKHKAIEGKSIEPKRRPKDDGDDDWACILSKVGLVRRYITTRVRGMHSLSLILREVTISQYFGGQKSLPLLSEPEEYFLYINTYLVVRAK